MKVIIIKLFYLIKLLNQKQKKVKIIILFKKNKS